MEIQVRELKTKDLFTVSKILTQLGKKGLVDLFTGVTSQAAQAQNEIGSAEVTAEELGERIQNAALGNQGMEMIMFILENAESATREFFADLIEMTPEEFDDTPLDTPIIIIEQLAERPEAVSFFKRALDLSKIFTNK